MNDIAELRIKEGWFEVRNTILEYVSSEELTLDCITRFDGYGNSIVRFVVSKNGRETTYEKYNSAFGAYELLKGRLK